MPRLTGLTLGSPHFWRRNFDGDSDSGDGDYGIDDDDNGDDAGTQGSLHFKWGLVKILVLKMMTVVMMMTIMMRRTMMTWHSGTHKVHRISAKKTS